MAPDCIIILTSVATAEDAERLARGAVECRLAACVQVSAGRSTYRWQGRIETEAEHYLSFKTAPEQREQLSEWIRTHHPYELPEIVFSRHEASADYAHWLRAETSPAGEQSSGNGT